MNKLITESVENILNKSVQRGEIAGANVLILKKGQEISFCKAGYQDMEQKIGMERDTLFRLFSMTKPITATAAMLLWEQNKIELGEPVSYYIPEFAKQMVEEGGTLKPVNREATLQDLLNMTAGLCYDGSNTMAERKTAEVFNLVEERLDSDHPVTTAEFAREIGKLPLKYQPGTDFMYSCGADIMGAVIEKVADMPFSEFLKKNIFEPLNMRDTDFVVDETKKHRLATPYIKDGQLKKFTDIKLGIRNDIYKKNMFESGGAGLVSTIDDYAAFASMLINGGCYNGTRILEERTVKFMTSSGLTSQQETALSSWAYLRGHSYANYLRICKQPELAVGHAVKGEYGWDGWMGCYFANLPNEKITILLMRQLANTGTTPMTWRIRNKILPMLINTIS